jgi:hypothetical protein
MFQVSMDAMENCLPFHRRRNDHSSRATVFPFTDSNLVKVEHKFSTSLMNMISKSIKRRLEKDSMNFKSWILLWNTLGFKKLFCMTRQKSVNPSSCDALSESLMTFVHEFSSFDCYVICRFGGSPVHELLLCVCGKFMMSPSGRWIVTAPKLRALHC